MPHFFLVLLIYGLKGTLDFLENNLFLLVDLFESAKRGVEVREVVELFVFRIKPLHPVTTFPIALFVQILELCLDFESSFLLLGLPIR